MALSIAEMIGIFGSLFSGLLTAFHVWRLRRAGGSLDDTLESYYTISLPYIALSGISAMFFFTAVTFPSMMEALLNDLILVDLAFLGLSLTWFGGTYRIFEAVNKMSESFFSKSEKDD